MSAFRSWPGRFGRFEKSFLVAAFCGFATTASVAEEPKGAVLTQVPVLRVPLGNDWKIEIIPGPAIGPSPVPKAELAARQAAQQISNPATGIVTAGAESAYAAGVIPAGRE